jgi:8-oxo-dGTP diphosphatase
MTPPTSSADVVVLTALELEYQAVRSCLEGVSLHGEDIGTVFEIGMPRAGNLRVAIACTGKGTAAATVGAERAIATFAPRALLFTGVAGALRDEIRLGDVVVATKIYEYGSGKEGADGWNARPTAWPAPHELEQLAAYVARQGSWRDGLGDVSVHFAPIASGDAVIASRTGHLAERLRRHYNDAAAVEMESAGAAAAGHLHRGVPVLAIRGISDLADTGKQVADADGWQPRAAAHAAAFTCALVALSGTLPVLGRPAGNVQNIVSHGGVVYAVQNGNIIKNPPATGA